MRDILLTFEALKFEHNAFFSENLYGRKIYFYDWYYVNEKPIRNKVVIVIYFKFCYICPFRNVIYNLDFYF